MIGPAGAETTATIQATIDGRVVRVPAGTTILEAARDLGIDIPTLCHDETLSLAASCRLCVVEIEGRPNLMPACADRAAPRAWSCTRSPRTVVEARRLILDLLLSDHPLDLPHLRAGRRLQAAGVLLPLRRRAAAASTARSASSPIESDNPLIERDMNKCILCGKCVRVCQEVQVTDAIDFAERGFESHDRHLVRPPARHVVLPLLRPVRRHLPDGRPHQQAAQGHAHLGPHEGPHHLPVLRHRLQLRPQRRRRQGHRRHRRLRRPGQPGLAVRQGTLPHRPHHSPDRVTTPLIKKRRRLRAGDLGRGARSGRRAPRRDQRRARRLADRRAQLGALHQRGQLPDAAPHAGGPRHQQHRPLRPYLTRSHGGRSGRHVRFRRDDQLDRRDRATTTSCSSSGPTPPRRTRSSATR